MTRMGNVAIGTIVAKNYFSHARVLAASLREHQPEVPLFVLLADEVGGCFDPAAEPFQLLRPDEMAIPQLSGFLFKYSRQQVVTAAKPYLLTYLLNQGYDRVIFLDADILILDTLASLWKEMSRHEFVLTPHLLGPPDGGNIPMRELNILQSGVCNGGFVGVTDSPSSRMLLNWWKDRVYDYCYYAIEEGAVYDQRWLHLVHSFAETHLLRDPGVNVAYWNLPERRVSLGPGGRVLVDGGPCRFFHFSGFDPDRPDAVTRYSDRLIMDNVGPAAALFDRYRKLLESAGYHETKTWPYAYGFFDNGVPIPDVARQLGWAHRGEMDHFGDPFQTVAKTSFFRWLNGGTKREPSARGEVTASGGDVAGEPLVPGSAAEVTRLWHAVWQQRADLKRDFPDSLGANRARFMRWAVESGMREYSIDELLTPFLGEIQG